MLSNVLLLLLLLLLARRVNVAAVAVCAEDSSSTTRVLPAPSKPNHRLVADPSTPSGAGFQATAQAEAQQSAPAVPVGTCLVFRTQCSVEEVENYCKAGPNLMQHLHLSPDALLTMPEMDFAEVITFDPRTADLLGFCDAEVVLPNSGCVRVMHRDSVQQPWYPVGSTTCMDFSELQQLLPLRIAAPCQPSAAPAPAAVSSHLQEAVPATTAVLPPAPAGSHVMPAAGQQQLEQQACAQQLPAAATTQQAAAAVKSMLDEAAAAVAMAMASVALQEEEDASNTTHPAAVLSMALSTASSASSSITCSSCSTSF